MRAKTRVVLEDAIHRGLRFGANRLRKQDNADLCEAHLDMLAEEIWAAIDEMFDFEYCQCRHECG